MHLRNLEDLASTGHTSQLLSSVADHASVVRASMGLAYMLGGAL
jgi:hypothetical protein